MGHPKVKSCLLGLPYIYGKLTQWEKSMLTTYDIKGEFNTLFAMDNLKKRVEGLKSLFFTLYPEGSDALMKGYREDSDDQYEKDPVSIIFVRAGMSVYYSGNRYVMDFDTMYTLCHDEEFVARFKPVFNRLIKDWAIRRIVNAGLGVFSTSGEVILWYPELENRLSELGYKEFPFKEFKGRFLLMNFCGWSAAGQLKIPTKSEFGRSSLSSAYHIEWGVKGDFYKP
jgi:hypothetical protein